MSAEGRQAEIPRRRRILKRLARAEIAFTILLASFIALAYFSHLHIFFRWDLEASKALQSFRSLQIFAFMRSVSALGDGLTPYVLTSIACLVLLIYRYRVESFCLLFSAAGSGLANRQIKDLIDRPRPTADLVSVFRPMTGPSFPSGHVTFYVCFFGFLFLLAYVLISKDWKYKKPLLVLILLPVIFIGLSRVYLGEHWPSDTLGAYIFGTAWLGLTLSIYRRFRSSSSSSQP
jgi:membrane-associated phospholipid phosphatase